MVPRFRVWSYGLVWVKLADLCFGVWLGLRFRVRVSCLRVRVYGLGFGWVQVLNLGSRA